MTVPIYVISNGDLAKATFDAVAIVFNSQTFNTAVKLAVTFAVLGTSMAYVYGRDITVFFRWFVIYFLVTTLMLGPKLSVQIIDSSDPMAVYKVDNIPYGLAYPASLITATAHGLVVALEDAYHTPDDFTYNKTGMLFGSKLFGLATEFRIIDPTVKLEFNEYVKNCVLGDILINKKYSMNDLVNSSDLATLLKTNPSPRRGIFLEDKFSTCKEALPTLAEHIKKDISDNGLKFFGKRLFGGKNEAAAASRLKSSLQEACLYYAGISNTALQIMTQNVMINGIRDGVLNYASETGAAAAFLNLSTTQAMERMRMSWATSRNMATYVLPIMHTDILLMLFCLFPVIVLLTLQPNIGTKVFRNYIYSILWVESWPLLFACLNLTASFYLQGKTGALAKGGFTISNMDLLALEHSDVANMAGYLMITIPFIAGSLVTGMAYAFNTAASYIGGVLQSSATSAASEVASGNISLGSASWGNVNANKFDVNSSLMRGHATEQLKSGVLETTTADGSTIVDASHAMSRLPVDLNLAKGISADISRQAGAELQAANDTRVASNHSLSNIESDLRAFDKSNDFHKTIGDTYSNDDTATVTKHLGKINAELNNIAQQKHCSREAALEVARSFAFGARAHGGLTAAVSGGTAIGQLPVNLSIAGGVDVHLSGDNISRSSSYERYGTNEHTETINQRNQELRESFDYVKNYSTRHHADTTKSEVARLATNISNNLNAVDAYEKSYAAHMSKAERLGEMASYVEHNAAQINANYTQPFVNWLKPQIAEEKFNTMVAGKTVEDLQELQGYADRFTSDTGIRAKLEAQFEHTKLNIDPNKTYQHNEENISKMQYNIRTKHDSRGEELAFQAKEGGVAFPQKDYANIKSQVEENREVVNSKIQKAGSAIASKYDKARNATEKHLAQAHENTVEGSAITILKKDLDPK